MASSVVLWHPSIGTTNRGRKPVDYIDLLKRDTGLDNIAELQTAMYDRQVWRSMSMLLDWEIDQSKVSIHFYYSSIFLDWHGES